MAGNMAIGAQYGETNNLFPATYDPSFQAAAGSAGQFHTADTQAAMQTQLLQQQNKRFNQLFPLMKQGMGQQGVGQVPAAPAAPALNVPAAPQAGAGGGNYGWPQPGSAPPVYSEGLVQKQVNDAVARNDSRTAGQSRSTQQDLAGRGVGANSPLFRALQASLVGQNNAANASADLGLRSQAAGLNAQDSRERDIAGLQSATQRYASDNSANAANYGSQLGLLGQSYGANLGFQGGNYQSQLGLLGEQTRSKNALLASLFGSLGQLG